MTRSRRGRCWSILSRLPKSVEARVLLGNSYLRSLEVAPALEHYRAALAMDPRISPSSTKWVSARSPPAIMRARSASIDRHPCGGHERADAAPARQAWRSGQPGQTPCQRLRGNDRVRPRMVGHRPHVPAHATPRKALRSGNLIFESGPGGGSLLVSFSMQHNPDFLATNVEYVHILPVKLQKPCP